MTDFKSFSSRVVYDMKGHVQRDIDTDCFTRATSARVTEESDLRFDEVLYANIINLDSWLRSDWAERMAEEIDLGDEGTFLPFWGEVTVRLDLRSDEVVTAAEHRAGEDATEVVYVLAQWMYLCKKADHINTYGAIRAAFDRVKERPDQPDDYTTDEYGGGRR